MKKTAYIIIGLTHVKTEEQKQQIRDILAWLEETFNLEILTWAFDVREWKTKPVNNVYEFDKNLALTADLGIVFFLDSAGSDGRGGEIFLRVASSKSVVAFAMPGIKVSTFARDALRSVGQPIHEFTDFQDMYGAISDALSILGVEEDLGAEQLVLNMAEV